jgi:hypothetical protein
MLQGKTTKNFALLQMAPTRMLKNHLRLRGGGDNGDEGNENKAEDHRRKRHYYNYSVKQKLAIVQEAYSKPN